MDCTYCILQDYIERPVVTLFVNLRSIFKEVDALLSEQPKRFFRFGTGELSDSLVLDDLTTLSKDYVLYFSGRPNTLIELKTKTDNIQNLQDLTPQNTVIAWSVNPQSLIDSQEFRTSNLEERLKAARLCQDKGYLLGFHFDPIVFFQDWEKQYRKVVDRIFACVEGSRIAWISLGSLRFPPSLKAIVQRRFPKSRIIYEEMIRGLDGKIRYPRPLRSEMYRKIFDWLKEKDPSLFIYICMESPVVWDHVMGTHPLSNAELDFWFARSLYARFPELEMEEPDLKFYAL
jgi:spore photoproduct lyase